MLAGSAGIPLSLIWDYSWECTIGVDLFWGPPHTATYISVFLAGLGALSMIRHSGDGVRLGLLTAPAGAWISIWGALAFSAAVLFDRWWQGAYGLGAGIWHPPQICKAVAFFAVLSGTLVCYAAAQDAPFRTGSRWRTHGFIMAGGLLLLLIGVVTLKGSVPNFQHGSVFYEVACGSYSLPLAVMAIAGRGRFPATKAALVYMGLACAMMWMLPLFPARPLTAPVYNPMDHLMPPPFPLLLVIPALGLDLILKRGRLERSVGMPGWMYSSLMIGIAGLAFAFALVGMQWFFSKFLLSGAADNWFLAGGGRHWPFFIKIPEQARRAFLNGSADELNESSLLVVGALAVFSTRVGAWVGQWLRGVRR
jgi:hypothetical protein